jgi:hypothetical protein
MTVITSPTNITYRFYPQKLGGSQASQFIGDAGDYFYNPADGQLRLSDGSTPGGINMMSQLMAFSIVMGM